MGEFTVYTSTGRNKLRGWLIGTACAVLFRKWVEGRGVKEVWIWGYHGGVLDLWESNMASPHGDNVYVSYGGVLGQFTADAKRQRHD